MTCIGMSLSVGTGCKSGRIIWTRLLELVEAAPASFVRSETKNGLFNYHFRNHSRIDFQLLSLLQGQVRDLLQHGTLVLNVVGQRQ